MAEGQEEDGSEMELQLLMPSAEEQRAIICSLESETAEESLHVYTVSQAWYDRWKAYVGLEQPAAQQRSDPGKEVTRPRSSSQDTAVSLSPVVKTTAEDNATTTAAAAKRSASSDACRHGKEPETNIRSTAPPGPIEMDLTDEDNISVDEKVLSD